MTCWEGAKQSTWLKDLAGLQDLVVGSTCVRLGGTVDTRILEYVYSCYVRDAVLVGPGLELDMLYKLQDYSLISGLQPHHRTTTSPHDYGLTIGLQPHHRTTASPQDYSLTTGLQLQHRTTALPQDYSLTTGLQPHHRTGIHFSYNRDVVSFGFVPW